MLTFKLQTGVVATGAAEVVVTEVMKPEVATVVVEVGPPIPLLGHVGSETNSGIWSTASQTPRLPATAAA
jgi:hypothetical protein